MKLQFLPLITLMLIGCTSIENLTGNNPIIDTLGVNLTQHNRDLADCQQYANELLNAVSLGEAIAFLTSKS